MEHRTSCRMHFPTAVGFDGSSTRSRAANIVLRMLSGGHRSKLIPIRTSRHPRKKKCGKISFEISEIVICLAQRKILAKGIGIVDSAKGRENFTECIQNAFFSLGISNFRPRKIDCTAPAGFHFRLCAILQLAVRRTPILPKCFISNGQENFRFGPKSFCNSSDEQVAWCPSHADLHRSSGQR